MNYQEHLLTCLEEECIEVAKECLEVAQRVSKALRFGLREVQPGQSLTNTERITLELCDLQAVIEVLAEMGIINSPQDRKAIDAKKAKLSSFMRYAESCGTLNAEPKEPGGER